jgi:hypothetical protein
LNCHSPLERKPVGMDVKPDLERTVFDSEHFFYLSGAKKRQFLTLHGCKVGHQPSGGCTNRFVSV